MKNRVILYYFLLILFIVLIIFFSRSQILFGFDKLSLAKCQTTADQVSRSGCYRNLIKSVVKRGDLGFAINIYKQGIKDNLDADGCHLAGHDIGRDVYESLKKDEPVKINDPMSECGYGFWHGFFSGFSGQVITQEVDKDDLYNLCNKILGSNLDLALCYHGLGLGFVGDPPDISVWGNSDKTILQGIKMCDRFTYNDDYMYDCYSGVFHQTFSYMKAGLYGLSLPTGEKIFNFCHDFDKKYWASCLNMLSPYMYGSVKSLSVLYEVIYTKLRWVPEQINLDIFTDVAAVIVDNDTDVDLKKDLLYCFILNKKYTDACLGGFYWSALNKDSSGKVDAINQLNQRCRQIPDEDNKNICLDFVSKTSKLE